MIGGMPSPAIYAKKAGSLWGKHLYNCGGTWLICNCHILWRTIFLYLTTISLQSHAGGLFPIIPSQLCFYFAVFCIVLYSCCKLFWFVYHIHKTIFPFLIVTGIMSCGICSMGEKTFLPTNNQWRIFEELFHLPIFLFYYFQCLLVF